MRPRYVINKGIQKKWTARGTVFEVGSSYTAVLYNPKDKTVKIEATATAAADPDGDTKNVVQFTWTSAQTELLKEGYASIEIYDSSLTRMAYRDNIAVIRKNSLQITTSVSAS